MGNKHAKKADEKNLNNNILTNRLYKYQIVSNSSGTIKQCDKCLSKIYGKFYRADFCENGYSYFCTDCINYYRRIYHLSKFHTGEKGLYLFHRIREETIPIFSENYICYICGYNVTSEKKWEIDGKYKVCNKCVETARKKRAAFLILIMYEFTEIYIHSMQFDKNLIMSIIFKSSFL